MIRLKTLLFEVSIDQLKTQFVDTGKISDSEFTEIVDASGGKSAYATWLTKQVASKIIKPEDLYKYNAYFKIFDRRKREYVYQDINQYKTPQDITQFISKSVEIANKEKADPSQQKGVAKTDRYAEFKIGEVDGFTVYELPKGRLDLYNTSCQLGKGTEWCTATEKTEEYFEQYIKKGPLFVFIKPGSTEKYQFSYEGGHYMDKDDNPITDNPTPVLIKLFQFIESRYSKYRMPLRVKILNFPNTVTKEDLNVKGDLDLSGGGTKITTIPNGLRVSGDLILNSSPITKLPEDLWVGKNLELINTSITELPHRLYVGRNLNLSETKITTLPANLTVKGDLRLNKTPITTLPTGLQVKGELDLSNTKITTLPITLNVGSLDIQNTRITSLPEGFQMNGDLDLRNTAITSLPVNLKIKGNLYIQNLPIKSLPANLTVKGELYASNTQLTSIPRDLRVKSLSLNNTPIQSLPDGLRIPDILSIRKTNISTIPKGLHTWLLDAIGTPLVEKYSAEEIYNMIKNNGGHIDRIYTHG
jgi:hypothetical protein